MAKNNEDHEHYAEAAMCKVIDLSIKEFLYLIKNNYNRLTDWFYAKSVFKNRFIVPHLSLSTYICLKIESICLQVQ